MRACGTKPFQAESWRTNNETYFAETGGHRSVGRIERGGDDKELRWDKEKTDDSQPMGIFLRAVPDSSPFVVLTEPERPQYDF